MGFFVKSLLVISGGLAVVLAIAEWGLAQQPTRLRKLAPGVETTISPDVTPEETFSVHRLVELHSLPNLRWTPNFTPESRTLQAMTQDVVFRRHVWCLELTFKPLRMIRVDIPQPSGKMQRKLIWYMVYRVRNTGGGLQPERQADGTYGLQPATPEVHFLPQFVLESHELKDSRGRGKAYLDRVIPVAMAPIIRREKPSGTLHNSVQISEQPIPFATDQTDQGVWGVVTWENIDPRIDYFSIYVAGLTNAYRWVDLDGAYRPGDPPGKGRRFVRKQLQLNFWRPGDQFDETESEIHFGTPAEKEGLYRVPKGVDHTWVFR